MLVISKEHAMHVGFLGLGAMGLPMATNLARAGVALTVYNRTAQKADALAAAGAAVASHPAEAAADVVITMVADDGAAETIVFGEKLLAAMRPGTVHISMSTISVALARRLAAAHAEAGSLFVSAPVFGRPDMAAAAKLFVVAAGPGPALDRVAPLFDAMGQRTFVVGDDPAAANVVKLSGNFLIAAVIECLGEAFALARKSGVDPARLLDVLTSTLFDAPVYRNYGALIAAERYRPAGFALPLGLKDLSLVIGAAQAAEVPMPVASLIRDHAIAALAHGDRDADWSAIAQVAARNAGL